MSQTETTLTLQRLQAIGYRSAADSRQGRRRSLANALIMVDAVGSEGAGIQGLGEAQFRGRESGDHPRRSWPFLTLALERLEGRRLDLSDRVVAIWSVRALMSEIATLAMEHDKLATADRTRPASVRQLMRRGAQRSGLLGMAKPHRGAMFGIETALLDVAARGMHLSVAELLSGSNSQVALVPPLLVRRADEVHQLEEIRRFAAELPHGCPLWIDFERRLPFDSAISWMHTLVDAASRGEIPQRIIIRCPLRRRDVPRRDALQRTTNGMVTAAPGDVSVAIAVDQVAVKGWHNPWARPDRSHKAFGIRPYAAGGLLPALRIAQGAAAEHDMKGYVVDSEAGGSVAFAALRHLAAAAPGLDGVVAKARDGEPAEVGGPGLGVTPPWEEMVDTVTDRVVIPPEKETVTAGPHLNTYREIPFLQPLGPNGTKGHLMEREALALGLSTIRYSKGAFTASDGVHEPLVFKWSRSPLSSAVALAMCTHKEATRLRLDRAGVPVPRGRTFRNGDFTTGREFADQLGYPVVVKPAMGVRGIGVVAGIRDRHELDLAFEQLSDSKLGNQDFIVEKHIPGKDYRIVTVGDRVIAAILREPASVVGDGVHNVAELLIRKNALRRLNPHLWGRPALFDAAARYQLARAGLTLESVPDAGQLVLLSNSSSLSQGGDSTDVLDELHPSVIEACQAAVRAIPGLAFCGVDFLLEDHTKPLAEQEAGICELNAHAAIGNCEYPSYGTPREVARVFMEECAKHFELDVSAERAETVSLRLTVRGRVTGVGYRAWMRRRALESGVTGWVRNVNKRTVELVISGETAAATAVAAAAVLGPRRASPTSVTTEHVQAPPVSGFSLVDRPPQELASAR